MLVWSGHEPLQKFRLKLAAIAGVAAPPAGDHKPFTHGGQGNGAHHSDGVTGLAPQPQNAVSVVIVLIHHGADGALENLQILSQDLSLQFQAV